MPIQEMTFCYFPKFKLLNEIQTNNITNAALLIEYKNPINNYPRLLEKIISADDPILKNKLQLKLKSDDIHIMDLRLINDCKIQLKLVNKWLNSLYQIRVTAYGIYHNYHRFNSKDYNNRKMRDTLEIYDKFTEIAELFQNQTIEYYDAIIKQIKKRTYNYTDLTITKALTIITDDTVDILFDQLHDKTNIRFTQYMSTNEIIHRYNRALGPIQHPELNKWKFPKP